MRAALMCGAATSLLTALPAGAQPVEGTYLGQIVTGFGSERVAIDTPQSVTVLEQEDLDRTPVGTVGEALEAVPGVAIAGSANPLGQAFNIRGIGLTEQPASEARIIVEVDGAPKFYEQYRMGSFFSDIELYRRVEILRGPASSTLYGSGALGGVIRFETKDAADFLEDGETSAVRARTSWSSNGDARLASVILANAFGDFESLVALNARQSEDYEDGEGDAVAATGGESLSGLVKGTWRLPEEQVLRLSYQQWRSTMDDAPLAATGGGAVVPVFGLTDRETTDRTAILSYENPFLDNDLLDLTVQLSFSDTTTVQDDHTDTSGGFVSCAPGTFAVVCDVDYGYETANLRIQNDSEAHLGAWEAHLTYGLEYTRIERTAESAVGAMGFHPEGTDEKWGLYAQGEFVWNDRLTIIPGIRADSTDRRPSDDIPGAEAVEDTAVSPKIAALYELGGGLRVFGSVARTERQPTLDELYSWSDTQGPALDLEAETSMNYEIGLAGEHFDVFTPGDTLQYKLTLFRNEVENLIQRTAPSQTVHYENVASAEFTGLELEAGYDTGRVFATLGYSTVEARDTTYDITLSSNPQDRLSLTLGGRVPDAGIVYGWRGTYAADITTQSRSTSSGAITTTEYDGYVTHDLFATWTPERGALEGMAVSLSVENVTDALWQSNLATDPGAGRSVALAVTHTF